jgi:hypothetical protein
MFTIQSLVDSFRMQNVSTIPYNVASRHKAKKGTVTVLTHNKMQCYGAGSVFTLVSGSRFVILCSSVADQDPGSGVFLAPGSGSGMEKIWIQDPG